MSSKESQRVCSPRQALEKLKPYSGEMPENKLILAANESPFNVPASIRTQLQAGIEDFAFNRYPDPLGQKLRNQIANFNSIDSDCVLLGNGGDELLLDIMLAWGGNDHGKGRKDAVQRDGISSSDSSRRRKVLQFTPTFSMYRIYAEVLEAEVINLPRDPESYAIDTEAAVDLLQNQHIDLCFLDNPSNPTGQLMPEPDVCRIIEASNALVVVDEAYFEFSGQSMLRYLDKYPNMVILRTFSKAYSLAGMRLGYVLAQPEVIDMLARVRMPYSVNSFTQWTGQLVMDNLAEFDQGIADIIKERKWLYKVLQDMADSNKGMKVWPSQANYLLFRVDRAQELWQRLYDIHDIYVRNFASAPGLENCLRVTVGSSQENIKFTTALRESIARLNLPDDFFSG
ncbi:MAG: aminotransferase class I/II-fold pyridoxal phosphate-dependent enzyme [Coriobacteriia bacterium]|nr:aminotransferase class I/II-fold pyridoxal phosphate-dependent enzyme [Coriobacteriia bacterium]